MKTERPKSKHFSTRPYRIWDEAAKRDLRWHYYASKENAIKGALVLNYALKIGNVFTVYNCNRPAMPLRQFKRTPTSILVLK